jgi:hypothetical protein
VEYIPHALGCMKMRSRPTAPSWLVIWYISLSFWYHYCYFFDQKTDFSIFTKDRNAISNHLFLLYFVDWFLTCFTEFLIPPPMKKIIACTVLCIQLLILSMSHLNAINPDVASGVWTREKAAHLARATLFYADTAMIETLYAAGSASAAVDILFPSKEGPDRNQFDAVVTNYTASGFNWGDGNHAMRLYQLMYAADPYEAKKKLFSLFEDIFSVNIDAGKNITYKDIYDQHSLIYNNMFGSYETLIKKILFNN